MARQHKSKAATASDSLTVLVAQESYFATKRIVLNAATGQPDILPYNAGIKFSILGPFPVVSIKELSDLLAQLEVEPRCYVIRGAPALDRDPGPEVRRTGSRQGDEFKGNFMTPDAGRRYVMIDMDKIALPEGMLLAQETLDEVVAYVLGLLPQEFHDASFHWQLSSSSGFKEPTRVSMHLWFWLDNPVPDLELRRWVKVVNRQAGCTLIDATVFGHVQPHYTAAPVFDGVSDPFPVRSGFKQGRKDSVNLVVPAKEIPKPKPRGSGTKAGSIKESEGSGWEYHLSSIGDHEGGDGFHVPLLRAAASYVATHGADGTDREALFHMLSDTVKNADASRHSEDEVDQRASREHIIPLIDSALDKYGQSRPKKTSLIKGIEPYYQQPNTSVEAIEAELDNLLPSSRTSNARHRR